MTSALPSALISTKQKLLAGRLKLCMPFIPLALVKLRD